MRKRHNRWYKRSRRLKRRGRLTPAEALALSTRTRSEWPQTKSITRYHRHEWNRKPRSKWRTLVDEVDEP